MAAKLKGKIKTGSRRRAPRDEITAMIEEATVDAYDPSEQASGFFTMIEQHLVCPFQTTVLGLSVTVKGVELNEGGQIVALCSSSSHRQKISIIDLPLPAQPPIGAKWIDAYRQWLDWTS